MTVAFFDALVAGKICCIIVRIEIEVRRVRTESKDRRETGAQKRTRLLSTAENVAICKIILVRSVRRKLKLSTEEP